MKKHYQCPDINDLVSGKILEIYGDFRNMREYQGRARLIKEMNAHTSEDQRVYIRAEIGSPKKQAPHTVIWSWQRWKIRFIDGPYKGWITARKIAYFVTVDNYYESGTS